MYPLKSNQVLFQQLSALPVPENQRLQNSWLVFGTPQKGKVIFGGKNIKEIPFAQLMGEVSYVAQDNFLFDESIRENIRLGKPDATDDEVVAAAKSCLLS